MLLSTASRRLAGRKLCPYPLDARLNKVRQSLLGIATLRKRCAWPVLDGMAWIGWHASRWSGSNHLIGFRVLTIKRFHKHKSNTLFSCSCGKVWVLRTLSSMCVRQRPLDVFFTTHTPRGLTSGNGPQCALAPTAYWLLDSGRQAAPTWRQPASRPRRTSTHVLAVHDSPLKPLTTPPQTPLSYSLPFIYYRHMTLTLDGRDRTVVQCVARFQRLTASQVNDLVFTGVTSRTPCDRSLRRLVERGYLMRRERRLLVGSVGGSAANVYQLGKKGRVIFADEERSGRTDVLHSLAIADSYIELKKLERAGLLHIDGWATEPDAWETVGGLEIRPDLRLDATRSDGAKYRLWIEIDLATEGKRQIKDKLVRYRNAVIAGGEWPVAPHVVWVALDADREAELNWVIQEGRDEQAKALFMVTTVQKLATLLT